MTPTVIVYDGDCGFCRKAKRMAERLDWLRRFEFHALQEPLLYERFPHLTPELCREELKLIYPGGRTCGGADAVLRMSLRLPLISPIAVVWMIPPLRQIARRLYRLLAANRYRLSAGCGLDDGED